MFWRLETQINCKYGGLQTDEGAEEQFGPRGSIFAEGNGTQFDRIHTRGKLIIQTPLKIHIQTLFENINNYCISVHCTYCKNYFFVKNLTPAYLYTYFSSSTQNGNGVSAKCRDARVEDLWSLTSFFGYSTQTFVLAVNLLDRFIAMMKVIN